MTIPSPPLTEFSEDQIKLFIDIIQKAKEKCAYHFELCAADDLQLLEVQLHNALNIVRANEKIIQS